MARRKQRVNQHIMEDISYHIIEELIPKEWVIRKFNRPDYGIDLVIELFEKVDDHTSETLGEYIFIQVKAVNKVKIKQEKIYSVKNVSKSIWHEEKSQYILLNTVKYSFDTNSLYTIQTLGASLSVLLFLVDIETSSVFFISLNDYIDKVILPKAPNYADKSSFMLTIPHNNKLNDKAVLYNAMRFYGKRTKLLAAFSKFYYQKNELRYLLGSKDFSIITLRDAIEKKDPIQPDLVRSQILYFISQIEDLDIWGYTQWIVLPLAKKEILDLKKDLENKELNIMDLFEKIKLTWHHLTNLGNMYEDICREWFLPKFVSLLTSYPEVPEIMKTI